MNRAIFEAHFEALLTIYNKRDPNGILKEIYFSSLEKVPDTEGIQAMAKFIKTRQENLPSVDDLKRVIQEIRASKTLTLPASSTEELGDPREGKRVMLEAIYRSQGDTPFYRSLFKAARIHGIPVPVIEEPFQTQEKNNE